MVLVDRIYIIGSNLNIDIFVKRQFSTVKSACDFPPQFL